MTSARCAVAPHPLVDAIVPAQAVDFLSDLHHNFESKRQRLLQDRAVRRQRIDAGELPSFRPETAHIRSGEWTVAPPPADLRDRRTEVTGPVTTEFMIEALNSGAKVFMADLEDATSPTWHNILSGQANIKAAYDGELTTGGSDPATLMVRTRAWHLEESHITFEGEPVSAALADFGLCFFHNFNSAVESGSGPYFYLPKLEGQSDARLWNQVFDYTEDRFGLQRGTIRATVLVETILAAFEMDEILFELRDHITGLHTGNWDYLFSVARTFRRNPDFLLPDREQITVMTPFMRAFTELLVSTCHRRLAHAIGGMSGVIPDVDNPARTEKALRKVTVDKRREAGDGFDGTRVAVPRIVPTAAAEFDKVLGNCANQVERRRDDVYVTAGDLLSVSSTRGSVSESGVRKNIRIVIRYLGEWLVGNGAVPIDDHLEDTAMAEVCRAQLWCWRHHQVQLTNGLLLDGELLACLIAEETDELRTELGDEAWAAGRFVEARHLLSELTSTDDCHEFLTTAAYPLL